MFLIILDYNYFKKFLKFIKTFNLPMCSLIPVNTIDELIDYPVFNNSFLELDKLIFLNLVTQTLFFSINYKNYCNKLKYLNLFYNFSLKFK